ncbi:MAG: hypothetical protein HYZ00_01905, partial [Candidatus Hydrogenedentes bacterium]|nr:hypothetical protein [Candidatus Hydrogenedentota bacterium]
HVQEADLWDIIEAIIKVQRDYGERTDRKQARLKYTLDRMGIEAFQQKVYEYAGREFPKPRNIKPTAQPDYLGWHKQFQEGFNYVGVWIENGRIRDFEGGHQFRSGLRAIVERFHCDVRLTPHHNVILGYIRDEDVDAVQAYLDEYNIPTDRNIPTIRRQEMACPALPLCPLAQSEAERAFPQVMEGLVAAGYGDLDVTIRMTGCPNGCARSASAEIGLVGKGPERYTLSVAGDYLGTRINETLIPTIKFAELVPTLSRLLDLWQEQRQGDEKFGDWSHRVGVEKLHEMLALEPAK